MFYVTLKNMSGFKQNLAVLNSNDWLIGDLDRISKIAAICSIKFKWLIDWGFRSHQQDCSYSQY